jgi:hypothetical protein
MFLRWETGLSFFLLLESDKSLVNSKGNLNKNKDFWWESTHISEIDLFSKN